MNAADQHSGFPVRLLVLSLFLGTVIVLAESSGTDRYRNNTLIRAIPIAPLPDAESETGFAGIEHALSRLQIRTGEQLPIDSALMMALAAAVEAMPDTLHPEGMDRIGRSLHKGWPEPAAGQIARLLMQYHAFRRAEKKLLSGMTAPTVDADESRLATSRSAQLQYFNPETVRSLFGEHNVLAAYSVRLRQLDEDPTKTKGEKAIARSALQREYEIEVRGLRGPRPAMRR